MGTRRLFTEHGLRCTRQRVAIYDRLRASKSHPTAEELFEDVRHRCDGLSLATVYNTLEALCDAGLARKLSLNCGCARFDADLEPHLHLLNDDTGEIHDVPADLSERLLMQLPDEVLRDIEQRLGVRVDRVSLHLHARNGVNGHSAAPGANGRSATTSNGQSGLGSNGASLPASTDHAANGRLNLRQDGCTGRAAEPAAF